VNNELINRAVNVINDEENEEEGDTIANRAKNLLEI
jgi:hypothetical protein